MTRIPGFLVDHAKESGVGLRRQITGIQKRKKHNILNVCIRQRRGWRDRARKQGNMALRFVVLEKAFDTVPR